MRKETGAVYIVGAGPGDPRLLTLRASELIKTADVVIYDRLVTTEILETIPLGTTKLYVGKLPGSGAALQGRINRLMLKEARAGKSVVRLKGGDPFLFSRGGEEVDFLKTNGVSPEVVPGVTSALAVPAFAGIPLTHRLYSSSVAIVTGHQAEAKGQRKLDWSKIAASTDTLVVLMGAARLRKIAGALLRGRLPSSTPLAVIQRGTTTEQRTLLMTLAEAARGYGAGSIESPALVVIGRTVSLAPRLSWFRKGKVRKSSGFRRSTNCDTRS